MPLISEWKPSDPIQILVYAKFKLGKSAGAFTFPRPVVFDFDDGVATARSPWFVKKYGIRWLFYEGFKDTKRNAQGIVTSHTGLDDSCRFFDEWMKPKGKWTSAGKVYEVGRDMFDTWIIDSGTTLSELCMGKANIVLGAQSPPLSKTHETALMSGLLIPKKQDYGAERSLFEQFIRMVKETEKNVVLICHEKEIFEGEGSAATLKNIVPLLTGKSAELVPLMFDEVYNLRIKPKGQEMVRYLQTQPDALRRCGTRYGIEDGTEWDYDSIKKQIDSIHAQQQKQVPVTQLVGATVAAVGGVAATVK